jgi:hypothetical protein
MDKVELRDGCSFRRGFVGLVAMGQVSTAGINLGFQQQVCVIPLSEFRTKSRIYRNSELRGAEYNQRDSDRRGLGINLK